MPVITQNGTKKAKAIAYAVHVMNEEGILNTGDQGAMQDIFFAGGYTLKNDNPQSRLQVSSSVLYKHWKSSKEPKIYRKLITSCRGINAVYSLSRSERFKTYEETKNDIHRS